MFCVSSVDTLTQYYELFEKVQAEKQQQDEAQGRLFKPLTIATIFSYGANEAVDTVDQNGLIHEESQTPQLKLTSLAVTSWTVTLPTIMPSLGLTTILVMVSTLTTVTLPIE